MIGCLRTRVRKQPIIALYFESEDALKFYNLEAWTRRHSIMAHCIFFYFSELKMKSLADTLSKVSTVTQILRHLNSLPPG